MKRRREKFKSQILTTASFELYLQVVYRLEFLLDLKVHATSLDMADLSKRRIIK